MILDEEVYFEHFGVKGMHWGVRKSPTEKQARRDEKAQKYTDKATAYKTKIIETRAGNSALKYRKIRKLKEKQATAERSAELKKQGKLTDKQRKLAIGAAATAAIVAAYATSQSINSGNARRLTEKGKMFVKGSDEITFKKNPKLADPNMGIDDIYNSVVKPINPNYGQPGTKMNCRRATYAYEMRRRGNDVEATRTTNARGQDLSGHINARTPGGNNIAPGLMGQSYRMIREEKKGKADFKMELYKYKSAATTPANVFNELQNQPHGARGEVELMWRAGGGHSVAWENVKGKVVIFDTQTGDKYTNPDTFWNKAGRNAGEARINRLDNIPLNDDFLLRWVKDA
jgi:hypothetical protein